MESTWITLGILLVGVIVVVGGVLVLRLHAFLALTLGALLVGMLTPGANIERHAVEQNAIEALSVGADGHVVLSADPRDALSAGTRLLLIRVNERTGRYEDIAELKVTSFEDRVDADGDAPRRAIARPISEQETSPPRRPTRDDLAIQPHALRSAKQLADQSVGTRVAEGFGSTCGKIGILIAMAAIIGKCLLDSGAADRIVRSTLKLLGERGAPAAFLSSGFLLAIPVFFDTVFYLMIPLGKAMRMRTGRNYLLYVLTIVAGGSMAHSLVPPTPGPLFVAEELGVDLGMMILAGCFVGLFTAGTGYVYAYVANRIWDLPLRESPDFSLDELADLARRGEQDLPPAWLAVLPILLPVVLIGGNTVLDSVSQQFDLPAGVLQAAGELGDKTIALVLSAVIALGMLIWHKHSSLRELARSIHAALSSGGIIILITAAGGAFGQVLQQTGVSGLIRDLPSASPAMIVCLAFLITAAVRTAQGSATVAMITAVGILAGIMSDGQAGFHPVYLALAIGCGSKPFAWMNDSGFWVIGKMSGMTEGETLKYVTPMSATMGFVGLAVILVGVTLFPMG